MAESPRRTSHVKPKARTQRTRTAQKNLQYTSEDGVDDIECSGEYCSSCTANLVADCIAVCCCPCAIVSVLILAFVKLPWMMSRRCFGLMKNKETKKFKISENGRKTSREKDGVIERGSNKRAVVVEKKKPDEFPNWSLGDSNGDQKFCEGSEAEKDWLELYDQVGHLGFGRVSSSGSGSQGKCD